MTRRTFTHLSQVEIRDIVSSFYGGEAKSAIATRLAIDKSTVDYHVRKYEKTYPEQSSVYALVKVSVKKTCAHPSFKCSLCGTYKDAVHRDEKEVIRELTDALATAHARLKNAGIIME